MSYKMLDDYNQDTFIHTPNINRIGNEGAKVKCYSTNSLCVPGRASLLTGNYGHKTGALNNSGYPSQSLITIPKILHAEGYYTALCGKWMLGTSYPKPEFDYWLWTNNSTSYYNDSAKYFNSVVNVNGHMTDFLTDSALQLIGRIDTPFFLMLNYNAPHYPFIPQSGFDSLYQSSTFSLPPNWNSYNINYPSFLYSQFSNIIYNELAYQNSMRDYYELMHGVEEATGKILDSLQANGLLDNTLVIFTTDNSYLMGEHHLRGKSIPYEECMRLPLFIRYPLWYQPGTLIDSSLTLNIDIAPTILEAAGVIDTFNMDGTSIHLVTANQFKRLNFLYEQNSEIGDSSSSVRTFRDNYFQYNRYYCSDTTEELFDLLVDPYQKKNLVHHYYYQDTLHAYRIKLDSIRLVLLDTGLLVSTNCYLLNPIYTYVPILTSVIHTSANCGAANGFIDVSILSGTPPYNFTWNTSATTEDLSNVFAGVYHLTITDVNGLIALVNVFINNINGPTLSEYHVNSTYNNFDGSINLMVNGTTQPYTYLWSNGATTQDIHGITNGEYDVTVTDNNGCISVLGVTINSIDMLDANNDTTSYINTALYINNSFTENDIVLYPNPAKNKISLMTSLIVGESVVELYNCFGIKLNCFKYDFSYDSPCVFNLNEFASGFYFIRIINKNKNIIKAFSIIK